MNPHGLIGSPKLIFKRFNGVDLFTIRRAETKKVHQNFKIILKLLAKESY